MAFQLSPGVNFSEVDLTNATAAVGTTEGAIAGVFRWGPTNERTLITSENQLVDVFGLPNTRYIDNSFTTTWSNAETFTTAANFLSYSDALYVVRVASDSAASAKVEDNSSNVLFEAKYKGELGNSVKVSWCEGTQANVGFTGVEMNTAAALTLTSATEGSIASINAQSEVDKLKVGDKISVPGFDQELDIETVTPGASGSDGTVFTFNPDTDPVIGSAIANAAPTAITIANSVVSFSSANATPGVTAGDFILVEGDLVGGNVGSIAEYDATNGIVLKVGTVGSSTYEVTKVDGTNFTATAGTFTNKTIKKITTSGVNETIDAIVTTQALDVALGAPVKFTAGNVPPISADGVAIPDDKIFFVVPVNPATGSAATTHGTTAFKLATSAANAAAGTTVQLTKIADVSSAQTSSFTGFTAFSVAFTLKNRFTGVSLPSAVQSFKIKWGDSDKFDAQPADGNYHILVKDKDGSITGTKDTIIESYEDVSITATAKKLDGTTNFISDVLENNSSWIKLQVSNISNFDNLGKQSSGFILEGGSDGDDETTNTMLGKLAQGYDLFSDASEVDISFVLQGRPLGTNGYELANYIIDNVAEARKDCVAFISPQLSDDTATKIVDFAGNVTRSSYAVVDSGYKYQYDKYADVYRYVPLNGDIAGLCARTDDLRDPWFSPAGVNRGNVKNVVKLNVNPNKAQRDLLYKNGVNPVITQPGQGTILFGDKTFQSQASAFDRINVRRLFIVLEKTIARAAKASLFEFNDEFTRAQFVNLVEPFLRDVQGRRGIYDFKVICDDSNNTGQVIDTNSFVGDIYVKPARSINFIQLNFVAVRTGVEFSEVVGAA